MGYSPLKIKTIIIIIMLLTFKKMPGFVVNETLNGCKNIKIRERLSLKM